MTEHAAVLVEEGAWKDGALRDLASKVLFQLDLADEEQAEGTVHILRGVEDHLAGPKRDACGVRHHPSA